VRGGTAGLFKIDETEISGASSLHHHILRIDLSSVRVARHIVMEQSAGHNQTLWLCDWFCWEEIFRLAFESS
jgi:hypothetical protein